MLSSGFQGTQNATQSVLNLSQTLTLTLTLTVTLSQTQMPIEPADGTAAQLKEIQRQLLIAEQRIAASSECVERQQEETEKVRHALHVAQAQVKEQVKEHGQTLAIAPTMAPPLVISLAPSLAPSVAPILTLTL